MKIRIQGNAIRLRLTKSEVASLAAGERVEQATHFSGSSKLISAVEPSQHNKKALTTFENGRLEVCWPAEEIGRWANSQEVGIEADQPLGDGQVLKILMEKDFECLHRKIEAKEDTFPNPRR